MPITTSTIRVIAAARRRTRKGVTSIAAPSAIRPPREKVRTTPRRQRNEQKKSARRRAGLRFWVNARATARKVPASRIEASTLGSPTVPATRFSSSLASAAPPLIVGEVTTPYPAATVAPATKAPAIAFTSRSLVTPV